MRLLLACTLVVAAAARQDLRAKSDSMFDAFLQTRTSEDPLSITEGTSTCGKANLCTKCLRNPDCVWCADNGGTCVPGGAKGPVEGTCKAWEASYCNAEPCGAYTSCATCVQDPFCGFAGGAGGSDDMVCVEGHEGGPLTGSVKGEWFYKIPSCPLRALPEGVSRNVMANPSATGGAGVDGEASSALKGVEGAAAKMAGEMDSVRKDEGQMLSKQKQAFDVMKHLRTIMDEWKTRGGKIEKEKDLDQLRYQKMWGELKRKREQALTWLRTGIDAMYKTELAEQELMEKRKQQETGFEDGENGEDAKVAGEGKNSNQTLDHLTSLKEDKSMRALEGWLKNMTSNDRGLMKKLARNAGNEVEKELHYAASRRMAREEAAWYACSYILANPDDNLCQDFHEKYAGTEKQRDLTEEEHTRVCNMVKSQMDRSSTLPIFKGSHNGRKNIQLAWYVFVCVRVCVCVCVVCVCVSVYGLQCLCMCSVWAPPTLQSITPPPKPVYPAIPAPLPS